MPKSPPDPSTAIFALDPPTEVLQAIGLYQIRFIQLEAWLDVTIGELRGDSWEMARHQIVNLMVGNKIAMIEDLLENRMECLGSSSNRSDWMEIMKRVRLINEQRVFLIHGSYVLPVAAESGAYFYKIPRNSAVPLIKEVDADGLLREAMDVKRLTDSLMHVLEIEFPGFNAHQYLLGH
jgi:hypothetical protein